MNSRSQARAMARPWTRWQEASHELEVSGADDDPPAGSSARALQELAVARAARADGELGGRVPGLVLEGARGPRRGRGDRPGQVR